MSEERCDHCGGIFGKDCNKATATLCSNCVDVGYPDDDYEPVCYECDEDGLIVICPDDICRAQGWCMHGDGMAICPNCKGEKLCN